MIKITIEVNGKLRQFWEFQHLQPSHCLEVIRGLLEAEESQPPPENYPTSLGPKTQYCWCGQRNNPDGKCPDA